MPPRTKRRQICLLSRSLYRVRLFDLTSVPVRERRSVLRNHLLAWSPFDQNEYRVVLRGTQALAFCWDTEVVDECFRNAGAESRPCLPEGLFRPAMAEDGLRLVRCIEGYELQVWVDGLMQASRWWPQSPDSSAQLDFLRTLDRQQILNTKVQLEVSKLQWQARPWADTLTSDALTSNWSRLEQLATGVTLVGLATLTGAQASQLYAAFTEHRAIALDLQKTKLAITPVLSARDRAIGQARELDTLARELTALQPIEVMQHMTALLPAKGVVLKDFELNGNKLKLGLDLNSEIQRSVLVKDLQSSGWFTAVSEVRETAGRNWVSFEMTVSAIVPPAIERSPSAAANREQAGGKP